MYPPADFDLNLVNSVDKYLPYTLNNVLSSATVDLEVNCVSSISGTKYPGACTVDVPGATYTPCLKNSPATPAVPNKVLRPAPPASGSVGW